MVAPARALKVHLNHESAQELKKFWDELNAPNSLRHRVDETKKLQVRLDELLTSARNSNQNAELVKLLSDLRALLDAPGTKSAH
ncbi:MAG: hypothetical protein WDN00_10295 [Limisphaerales bacterium]